MSRLDIVIYAVLAAMIGYVGYNFADEYRQVHYGDPHYDNLVDQCYSLRIGPPESDGYRQLRRTLANATQNYPGTRAPLAALSMGLGMPDYKMSQYVAFFENGLTRGQRAQICHIIESNVPKRKDLEAGSSHE
ncbi:hypothetical protein [Pseudomonas serbica]|jgi:hypothetical protein|uniref:hypothetical protein n=1 Tax=Pseudomonas serbica TaxID=2965074 RepID=UPI00237BBB47|nr:hypothetical protein [Pseudomonas serbica]